MRNVKVGVSRSREGGRRGCDRLGPFGDGQPWGTSDKCSPVVARLWCGSVELLGGGLQDRYPHDVLGSTQMAWGGVAADVLLNGGLKCIDHLLCETFVEDMFQQVAELLVQKRFRTRGAGLNDRDMQAFGGMHHRGEEPSSNLPDRLVLLLR